VVTSRFSGPIDEVFHDGEDGYIVPSRNPNDYADKIIALLEDPYVLKEAKRKAFLSSKRFSEDSIVEEWKKILG
jgi:glycosyltransferase involved in cell wall biosynthesis